VNAHGFAIAAGVVGSVLACAVAYAQEAPPVPDGVLISPQRAYTLADPVRPDGLGLATTDGRFSISASDHCADVGIVAGLNVELWQVQGFSGLGVIAPIVDGATEPDQSRMCDVRFEQREPGGPCLLNDDGLCDVAREEE
jgi:hypothetical protein